MSLTKYELMVIVDPEVDDRSVAPLIDKFLTVVPQEGGTVTNIDVWGRRRFAYPIQHKTEGSYVVVDLTSEPNTVNEVDRLLKLNDSIVRTKVLRKDEAVAVASEV